MDSSEVANPAWRGGLAFGATYSRTCALPPESVERVKFLGRLVQFLIWVVVVGWIGRKLLGRAFGTNPTFGKGATQPPLPATPLYRDPVCGTHIPAEISYSLNYSGQAIHFCSAECRDRYLSAHSRAAGA